MLYNNCNIKELEGVFDTQIAHRMYYDNLYNTKGDSKNVSISLASLIKIYLGIEYELKGEMHHLMSKNPYLWKTRPISKKLNFYAGSDVLYLPKIYNIICECCEKNLNNLNINDISKECKKYLSYVNINLKIKNFNKTNIAINSIVQGLIK